MIEKSNIEEIIARDGAFVSTISGYSMSPMLKDRRDTVVISRIAGEIKKYDVILYRAGEKYVLHRVIKVKADHYVTCGDNCTLRERVPKDSVIGILSEVWRGEEKLDLASKAYLRYSRRQVAAFYPRKTYRGLRKFAANAAKKIIKKGR